MKILPLCLLGLAALAGGVRAADVAPAPATAPAAVAQHTFVIGDTDFLLDGKRLQIRCGELHFARVPREYWRDRLQRAKAMGLNTVCAYLFWNVHEWEQGRFDWQGQADAAEFCRLAKEEGLWVILRPGPYACAEWEMGGMPWWLLKNADIKLRTRDPLFIEATRSYLKEVGRVLGPQQITHGGPILMVQVENEYGFYGTDIDYMNDVSKALTDGGFDVPLFACNPTGSLKRPTPSNLFKVVNFGRDPATGFKALRDVQPKGPLMCGEFYPGWFDTWGAPHHLGNTAQYLKDLEYMLANNGSFSIYMAHGGTSFGMWSGADRPFKPDTSSYDYDAPIAENGALGEKFRLTRELMAKYLLPGETLPPVPANLPTMAVSEFAMTEWTPATASLGYRIEDETPRTMEALGQSRGAILYRTTLPAGPAATLGAAEVHDFGFVSVNGKRLGVMDRRFRNYRVEIPERTAPAQLEILVYALGRVNFGAEVHDRKGLHAPVTLTVSGGAPQPITGWQEFSLSLDDRHLASLRWEKAEGAKEGAGFWRGSFNVEKTDDTYLDLSNWGFGVVWINGHCLARFWNIGPTQTAFVPGPWLRAGRNEVVIFDLVGPTTAKLAGVATPVLDKLRPELDFTRATRQAQLRLNGLKPVQEGAFTAGPEVQDVRFAAPVDARQLCFEAVSSHDGKPMAAVAELDLLDASGQPLPHTTWTIAYASSQEKGAEDGSAGNAIDGQTANAWITATSGTPAPYPHRLVIDLGAITKIGGLRYTPRAGAGTTGRIKTYRIFAGSNLVQSE